VVSNKKIFKISTNQNTLWALTAEQKSAKLARNVHWMVLYQICVFGADLKSNMAARVRRFLKFQPIRTHYGPWQPCWISDQHQKQNSCI
jgi:hypothetical protein